MFAFSCKKEQMETVQESIPPDITYSILDSGKVIFKNTYPKTNSYYWEVTGNGARAEKYYFNYYDPYIVFPANGKKHIEVNWTDSSGTTKSKRIELEVTNAIPSKDFMYLNGVILGDSILEEWYPRYAGARFVPNGWGDFLPYRTPLTYWLLPHLEIYIIDLNEKSSLSPNDFRQNLKTGSQPLAEFIDGIFPSNNTKVNKKGWGILINYKNFNLESKKNSLEQLKILEIKEAPIQKFYSGMEENVSFWITWHYDNGLQGNDKINFTTKSQYFFKE